MVVNWKANQSAANFDLASLVTRYQQVRSRSSEICSPLEIEDFSIQPMDDASPPKWHLAHTSWFFGTFLLKPYCAGYIPFNDAYEYLFNSYYNGVGAQFPRPKRGNLSRPTVAEIRDYRDHVDQHMLALLNSGSLDQEGLFRTVLGTHHEEQHQELMLTDIKHDLGNNPLFPVYKQCDLGPSGASPLEFFSVYRGTHEIGHQIPTIDRFVFDNESPRHTTYVGDYKVANRLVTNGEYLAFINDGGYSNPHLWLSDAWSLISSEQGFKHPLYWVQQDGQWYEYTLAGLEPLSLDKPVVHVSAYEADAYARWFGARLPTEAEWEIAAGSPMEDGNYYESGRLHPAAAQAGSQFYGDVWEWTSSSYGPYPGFETFPGQLGEYNGKFMANQLVLRGGSCVTPKQHIRQTYRNFFYAKDRWQFSGIRLAKN